MCSCRFLFYYYTFVFSRSEGILTHTEKEGLEISCGKYKLGKVVVQGQGKGSGNGYGSS